MSCSPKLLKRVLYRVFEGITIGICKEDTRSLGCSSQAAKILTIMLLVLSEAFVWRRLVPSFGNLNPKPFSPTERTLECRWTYGSLLQSLSEASARTLVSLYGYDLSYSLNFSKGVIWHIKGVLWGLLRGTLGV